MDNHAPSLAGFAPSAAARFWAKVDKNGPPPAHRPELGACWLWTAATTKGGYGRFKIAGVMRCAHVISVASTGVEVPDEMQVDHLCRVRACVNPDHLEVVTPQVNVLRGETVVAANAVKTHC